MKNKKFNLIKKFLPILILLIGSFFVASSVLALDTGLQYGTVLGLGTQDLRSMIMNVVRVLLGFLGIVAIIILLYGGFTWMTSAGNEEKISKAKDIIKNAVIGIVIILSAFAIVSFIISKLSDATGITPGISCTPNACVACQVKCNADGNGTNYAPGECNSLAFCGLPPNHACPKPASVVPTICSIEAVRGVGPGGVPQGYAGDFVTIEGWYFDNFSSISQVKFENNVAGIVSCEGAPIWYQQADGYSMIRAIVPTLPTDISYGVTITNATNQISTPSQFIIIPGEAGPGLACLVPAGGKNDDVLNKAEGVRFGNTAGGLFFNQNQSASFNSWSDTLIDKPVVPHAAVSGNVKVKNSSSVDSNSIWFTVTCGQNSDCTSVCCKSNMCQPSSVCEAGIGESCDPDKNTPACEPGGLCQSGLVCDTGDCICRLPGLGENCDTNSATPSCEPGNCANDAVCFADNVNCTCQGVPVIYQVSPNDGAPNNFITIYGKYFGASVGHVYFTGAGGSQNVEAQLASAVNTSCSSTWDDTQIIVVVPAGASNGPIKVTTASNISDTTNNSRGPAIPDFTVNSIIRPGVCRVLNTNTNQPSGDQGVPIRIEGIGFTNSSRAYFASVIAAGTHNVSGNKTITGLKVPNSQAGIIGVRVKEGSEYSNPYNFTVSNVNAGPRIYSFSPTTGARGTYVTLTGINFGQMDANYSHVKFVMNTGAEFEADYSFPQECATSFWKDTQIIVKVPNGLQNNQDYLIKLSAQAGTTDTSSLSPSKFTVDPNIIRPNICKVTPDNGPVAVPIVVVGENLDSVNHAKGVTKLIFTQNITQTNFTASGYLLNTTIPLGTVTGPFRAYNVDNTESNPLNFRVGACTVGSCTSSEECCSGGTYQGSCMPTGGCSGTANKSAFKWSFTTGVLPGACSNDIGLCQPNSALCSDGYTCDPNTCNCEPTGVECSTQPYPVCSPSDSMCASDKYCDNTCKCKDRIACDANTNTPQCEPGSNCASLGTGWYCKESNCYCYAGIPCDLNTNTPQCEPDDNKCSTADPNLACDLATCYCQPKKLANKAAYLWNFHSFTLGPEVVNECNRTSNCSRVCAQNRTIQCSEDTDCVVEEQIVFGNGISIQNHDYGPCIKAFSSPSPLFIRDGEVYTNSIVSASFTQKIQDSTINTNTVIVKKCNTDASFNSSACSQVIGGDFQLFTWNYGLVESEGFNFTPTELVADTWYEVSLTNGIIGETGLPLIPYKWQFKVKSGSEVGNFGCISCQPGITTLRSRYNGNCAPGDLDCQAYLSSAWDQDHVCVQLNGSGKIWDWYLNNESARQRASFWANPAQPAVPGDAPIYEKLSSNNQQTVYARSETNINDPVKVKVQTQNVPQAAYQYGDNICDLNIDFTTPVVVKRWPDCNGACTNSRVGAAFSVAIQNSTVNNNSLLLYACGNNPNCRPGWGTCSTSGAYCNSLDNTGCPFGETCNALPYDNVPVSLTIDALVPLTVNGYPNAYLADSPCYDINGDGEYEYCLMPNTYYRVILRNSITGTNGKHLGGLNYDDIFFNGISTVFDSYSWIFKTQNNMCAPGRVDVIPSEKWLPIGDTEKYASYPFASGDTCDPEGQPLIAASFTWEWQSSQCRVADLFANAISGFLNTHQFFNTPPTCTQNSDYSILRNGCGNGVIGAGEDCDDSNILSGDGCSSTCLNEGTPITATPGLSADFNGMNDKAPNAIANPFTGTLLADYINSAMSNPANLAAWGASATGGQRATGALKANSETGYSAIVKDNFQANYQHYNIKIKIKTLGGVADTGDAGLVFGYQDYGNFLTFGWQKLGLPSDPDHQKFLLAKTNSGNKTKLVQSNRQLNDNNWHEIKIEVINYTSSAVVYGYFDNVRVAFYTVNSPVMGKVGAFVSDPKTIIYFDELVVEGKTGICGNKIIEKGEECEKKDDNTWPAYCSASNCLLIGNTNYFGGSGSSAVCGNGIIDAGETCDNGQEPNHDNSDGCSDICLRSGFTAALQCGNGIVDLGEECDNNDFVRSTWPSTGDGCTGVYQDTTRPNNPTGVICSSFDQTQCESFGTTISTNHKKWCYWNGTACRVRPCILESNSALGNQNYGQSVCGNGEVEAGEECDLGGYCRNSYGGISACNFNNGSACATGVCGSNVCRDKATSVLRVCDASTATLCKDDICGGNNASVFYPQCTNNCLNGGSTTDGRSHQVVQGLFDGETNIQAWTSRFLPSRGGPLGQGQLAVGNFLPENRFYIIDQWPNCYSACLDADIGGQFNKFAKLNTINDTNINIYECGSDSECSQVVATKIIGTSVTPFNIIAGPLNSPDAFRINLPISYNPIDDDSDPTTPVVAVLLPNTYYRVVVHKAIKTADDTQNLDYLNYDDPTYTSIQGNDSYSWIFKTQVSSNLCGLSRVQVNPKTSEMFTGRNRFIYNSMPWTDPDECSALGQRLNPYRFNWRWDDVEMTKTPAPGSVDINGADILTDNNGIINSGVLVKNPPTDGDSLKDGCGNGVVEYGEDCDPGLTSTPGCGATCQFSGSTACLGSNVNNCCGNDILDPGEECEPSLNGGICPNSGLMCNPLSPGTTCGTDICNPVCSALTCLFNGNANSFSICGNGFIETNEECDPGSISVPGCTNACRLSGAVPGLASVCGDNLIGVGEECDDGGLTTGTGPVSNDGCTGNNDYSTAGCVSKLTQNDCESSTSQAMCYWNGATCKQRPCLVENRSSLKCRNRNTKIFDFKQNPNNCQSGFEPVALSVISGSNYSMLPVCGNGIVEFGEECDDGGRCLNDEGKIITCTFLNNSQCAKTSPCNVTWGYCTNNGLACGLQAGGAGCTAPYQCLPDGCGFICLHNGSIATDNKKDPYQIIQTVDYLNAGTIKQVEEEIRAWSAAQTDRIGVGNLKINAQSSIPFKIIGHQPLDYRDSPIAQCRNVAIWAIFSQPVKLDTLNNNNFKLCQENCDNHPNLILSTSTLTVQGRCNSDNKCEFPGADVPVMEDSYCLISQECVGTKVIINKIAGHCSNTGILCNDNSQCGGALCDFEYLSAFKENNVRATADVKAIGTTDIPLIYSDYNNKHDYSNWKFNTGNAFCECNYIGVNIWHTSSNVFTTKDYFTCATDDCGSQTPEYITDDDARPRKYCSSNISQACTTNSQCSSGYCIDNSNRKPGNQHEYLAQCFDTQFIGGTLTPVSLGVGYDWIEMDPDSLIFLSENNNDAGCSGIAGTCFVTPGEDDPINQPTALGQPKGKNGQSVVHITGKQYRSETSNIICAPTPSDLTCVFKKSSDREVDVNNFICDNPWPVITDFPYRDNQSNGVLPDLNFEMYYCRDNGNPGFDDDLPALNSKGPAFTTRGGVLKEIILPIGVTDKALVDNSTRRGQDYISHSCNLTWFRALADGAASCFINPFDIDYQFNVPSAGNYSLSVTTYNYPTDLSGLLYCDTDNNGFIKENEANMLCNPVTCINGCLPITHRVLVLVDDLAGTPVATVNNIAAGANNPQTAEVDLGTLTVGLHTIFLKWTNDIPPGATHDDSNITVKEVKLIKNTINPTGDAVGVRVMSNPLHLSAQAWYKSGLCGGQAGNTLENICTSDNECSKINLLKNPSFESGTSDWLGMLANGSMFTPTINTNTTNIKTGTKSLKLSLATANLWGAQVYSGPSNAATLAPGEYTFSAWIKSPDKKKVGISVQETLGSPSDPWKFLCTNRDCDAGNVGGDRQMVCAKKTGDWEKVTCNFSLKETTNVQMLVRLPVVGDVYVDDMQLYGRCNFNIPNRASAVNTTVDGYPAVKDGRTVYVAATNYESPNLYSDVYMLSYSQNAKPETQEIFSRILDQKNLLGRWSYNSNLSDRRVCNTYGYFAGTKIVCNTLGISYTCNYRNQAECEAQQTAKGCYWSSEENVCNARLCTPIYCNNNFECPNLSCNADKRMAVRDSIRFGDLRDGQISLEKYFLAKKSYPLLASGSYIASTTFSTWPSWKQTLSNDLSTVLANDPLNMFRGCITYYCDTDRNGVISSQEKVTANSCTYGAMNACTSQPDLCIAEATDKDQEKTCWNEVNRAFACPAQMFTYAYHSTANGTEYQLFANMEFNINNGWITNPAMYQLPYYGNSCQKLNFEISEVRGRISRPAEAVCSTKYCWGANGLVFAGATVVECSASGSVCPAGSRCTGDADADGVCDVGLSRDNCTPALYCQKNAKDCYNPDQRDSDGDGLGNVCDLGCSGDKDSDTRCDEIDNCPTVKNTSQTDSDGDGIGDACDPCTDIDSDGSWDVDTGANDNKICPKDNCPYVAGGSVAPDRPKYCLDATGKPNSSKVCDTTADCPSGTCGQVTNPTYQSYNPRQEDYDNDGVGYVCDTCVDYDKDNFGDWTFFTQNSNITSVTAITANKLWHFGGCSGVSSTYPALSELDTNADGIINNTDESNYLAWFDPSPRPACPIAYRNCDVYQDGTINRIDVNTYNAMVDSFVSLMTIDNYKLDNCPGDPYGMPCYDQFGIKISCKNTDQNDKSANGFGDICDDGGNGRVDPGEECDCGDTTLSYDPNNPFVCTTLNNDANCSHTMRYGDCCSYCKFDATAGHNVIAQSCGPRYGDCIVNGPEECDCCDTEAARLALPLSSPGGEMDPLISGITCMSATSTPLWNEKNSGPETRYSTDGVLSNWCNMGLVADVTGPRFGDGIIQSTYEACDCGGVKLTNKDTLTCDDTCDPLTPGDCHSGKQCIKGCTSLNDVPCKTGASCDKFCAYCTRKDTAINQPDGVATEGSNISYAGRLCVPCSETVCDAFCINSNNDGCCRPEKGEVLDNEYACPVRVGDTVLIATHENQVFCQCSSCPIYCHPRTWLTEVPGGDTAFIDNTDFGVAADKRRGSPMKLKFLPGNDDCQTGTGRPTNGAIIKNGDCVSIAKNVCPITDPDCDLTAYKLGFGGSYVQNNASPIVWQVNIDSAGSLTLGSIFALRDGTDTANPKYWSARWGSVLNPMPVHNADKNSAWEKFMLCTVKGYCEMGEVIDECDSDAECQAIDACTICNNPGDEFSICQVRTIADGTISCVHGDSCCPLGCDYSNDHDCDGVKINDVITLKTYGSYDDSCTLTNTFRNPTWVKNSQAENFMMAINTPVAEVQYRIIPAVEGSCGGSVASPLPMPGKGPAWVGVGGNRTYFKNGDCFSLSKVNDPTYPATDNLMLLHQGDLFGVFGTSIWMQQDPDPASNDFDISKIFKLQKQPIGDKGGVEKLFVGDVIELQKAVVSGTSDDRLAISWCDSGMYGYYQNSWNNDNLKRFTVCDSTGKCQPDCKVDADCGGNNSCKFCKNAGLWTAACVPTNYCAGGDGCCPVGCNSSTDTDCQPPGCELPNNGCCQYGQENIQTEYACPVQTDDVISVRYDQTSRIRYWSVNDTGSGDGPNRNEWDLRANRESVGGWEQFRVQKCTYNTPGCVVQQGPIHYGDIVQFVSLRDNLYLDNGNDLGGAQFECSERNDRALFKVCSDAPGGGCSEGGAPSGTTVSLGKRMFFETLRRGSADQPGNANYTKISNPDNCNTDNASCPIDKGSGPTGWFFCNQSGFCGCQPGEILCGGTCQPMACNIAVANVCEDWDACTLNHVCDPCTGCSSTANPAPECQPCSAGCNSVCRNAANDGCCRPDQGDNFSNEYACPLKVGDTMRLITASHRNFSEIDPGQNFEIGCCLGGELSIAIPPSDPHDFEVIKGDATYCRTDRCTSFGQGGDLKNIGFGDCFGLKINGQNVKGDPAFTYSLRADGNGDEDKRCFRFEKAGGTIDQSAVSKGSYVYLASVGTGNTGGSDQLLARPFWENNNKPIVATTADSGNLYSESGGDREGWYVLNSSSEGRPGVNYTARRCVVEVFDDSCTMCFGDCGSWCSDKQECNQNDGVGAKCDSDCGTACDKDCSN